MMRISELIAELEKVKAEHGDMLIVVEGQLGYFEAERVDVVAVGNYSFIDATSGVVIS